MQCIYCIFIYYTENNNYLCLDDYVTVGKAKGMCEEGKPMVKEVDVG